MAAGTLLKKLAKEAKRAGPALEELKSAAAPYLRTSKSSTGDILPRTDSLYTDVEQADLPRNTGRGKGISLLPRMEDMLASRPVREGIDRAIDIGADLGMLHWYGTEPLRVAALNAGLSEKEFQRMLAHYASASQRNPVPKQNQIGSLYWQLDRSGALDSKTALLTKKRIAEGVSGDEFMPLPEGYGSFAQGDIFRRAKMLAGGRDPLSVLDPKQKLGTFYENLRGNLRPVTVDVNASKYPAILSRDPRWLENKVVTKNDDGVITSEMFPRRDYMEGKLSMNDAVETPGLWISAPDGSDYYGFEQLYKRAAQRHGIAPAEAQAAAWYGSGDVTALKSAPELYIDNFQRLVKERAIKLGKNPVAVLDDILKGKEHLAEGGPVQNFGPGGIVKGLAKLAKKYNKAGLKAVQEGSDIRKTSFDAAGASPHGLTMEQWKERLKTLSDKTLSPEEARAKTRAELESFLRLDRADVVPSKGYAPGQLPAFATYERTPWGSGNHLAGLPSESFEERLLHAQDPTASWTLGGTGRDVIYDALEKGQRPTVDGLGSYTDPVTKRFEQNPAKIAQPGVSVRGGQLSARDQMLLRLAEGTRAYVDAQGAGAAHALMDPVPGGRGALHVPLSELPTPELMQQLQELGKGLNLPDLAANRGGVTLAHFYPEGSPTVEDLRAAMEAGKVKGISELASGAPSIAGVDGVYVPMFEDFRRRGRGVNKTMPSGPYATRNLRDLFGSYGSEGQEALHQIDSSPEFRRAVAGTIGRDAETAARLGLQVNPKQQNARRMIVKGGLTGLFQDLTRRPELYPSLFGTGLALGALQPEDAPSE